MYIIYIVSIEQKNNSIIMNNILAIRAVSDNQEFLDVDHNGFMIMDTSLIPSALVLDGVNIIKGDWVLLKDQDTRKEENGLFYVEEAGSPPAPLMDDFGTFWKLIRKDHAGRLKKDMMFYLTEGNNNTGTIWRILNEDPITSGFTELEFIQNVISAALICASDIVRTVRIGEKNFEEGVTHIDQTFFTDTENCECGNLDAGSVIMRGGLRVDLDVCIGQDAYVENKLITPKLSEKVAGDGVCVIGIVDAMTNPDGKGKLVVPIISEKTPGEGVCFIGITSEGINIEEKSKILVDEICEKNAGDGICVTGIFDEINNPGSAGRLLVPIISEKIPGEGVCFVGIDGEGTFNNNGKILVAEICEKVQNEGICITGIDAEGFPTNNGKLLVASVSEKVAGDGVCFIGISDEGTNPEGKSKILVDEVCEKTENDGVCITGVNNSKLLVDEVCEKTPDNGVCITGTTNKLLVDCIEKKDNMEGVLLKSPIFKDRLGIGRVHVITPQPNFVNQESAEILFDGLTFNTGPGNPFTTPPSITPPPHLYIVPTLEGCDCIYIRVSSTLKLTVDLGDLNDSITIEIFVNNIAVVSKCVVLQFSTVNTTADLSVDIDDVLKVIANDKIDIRLAYTDVDTKDATAITVKGRDTNTDLSFASFEIIAVEKIQV